MSDKQSAEVLKEIVTPVNHEADELFEAIGLNKESVEKKIDDFNNYLGSQKRIAQPSYVVEYLEQKFNKRELALMLQDYMRRM